MPGTRQAAEHDPNNPNYLICPKSLMARASCLVNHFNEIIDPGNCLVDHGENR